MSPNPLLERPLALAEIFCSVQGESTWAGLPCVFVRLAGCNLRCRWCDTRYAYKAAMHLTPAQVVERVGQWAPVKLVTVTGGEPLLQGAAVTLMQLLLDDGCAVLLETNGSLPVEQAPEGVARVVDVKCPGSGEEDSFLHANLDVLRAGRDQLKFVLSDRNDYEYARAFLPRVPQGVECLFSPVFGMLAPAELAGWIVHDRLPVRMQLQLHKLIWGPETRGV